MSGRVVRARGRWIAALAAVLVLIAACGSQTGGDSRPAAEPRDTLVVAIEEDLNTLDPQGYLGTNVGRTLGIAYDTLVNTNTEDGSIQPGLARDWDVSDDGTVYTFYLREDVKFQDGTPFNAEAVKVTFDRALNPNHPYHYGPYPFPPFMFGSVDRVEVVDDYTVQIVLRERDPAFFTNLPDTSIAIVSPTALEKHGRDFALHGAGTGAFRIVEWQQGQRVVMEANPDYWQGAPKVKRIIFTPVKEEAARLTQLKNGNVDIVAALNPQLLPEAERDENIEDPSTSEGIHTWFVILNTQDEPFNNVLVRQAANYAVDWHAIVDQVLNGAGTVTNSFAFPDTPFYTEAAEKYSYDPERARALLAEAGYPDGVTVDYLVPSSGSGMIAPREIATIMQAQMEQAGFKVNIEVFDWNTYLGMISANGMNQDTKNYDMAQMSWMVFSTDPTLIARHYLQCNSTPEQHNGFNIGYYCNEEVHDLLQRAIMALDEEEQYRFYHEAQVKVIEDAPWIFGFHGKNVIATRSDVHGVTPYPNMNSLPLYQAYVSVE